MKLTAHKRRLLLVLLLTVITLSVSTFLLQQIQGKIPQLAFSPIDISITTSFLAAASTIVGVLIGHMLTSRTAQDMQSKSFKRATAKGIRSLLTELEDNEELVKRGKEISTRAFDTCRKEPWFLPPIVNDQLEVELNEVYRLLAQYNEEMRIAKNVDPDAIEQVLSKYMTQIGITSKIHAAERSFRELGQRIIRNVWKW